MKTNLMKLFSKQRLLNNLGLKITSLVVAIVLWMVVINITDPIVTTTYRNVSVRMVNTNIVTDNGKTLEVLDGTNVIPTVTVKAPRSVIQNLSNSSDTIVAIADLKNLSSDSTTIPIELSTAKFNDKIDSIRSSVENVRVSIEERKTLQLPIYATTSGEIEGGYILGDINLSQNQVRVSGPASVIESISRAEVDVPVTGFTETISTVSDIILYDVAGNKIVSSLLTLNVDAVNVDVGILATKKVPIYYATTGTPAVGHDVTGEIECNPETVVVAGDKSAISHISMVNIPSSELNITGQTSNMLAVLNISDYLPEGIRLAENQNAKVSITVYIEPFVENTYGVYLRNILIDDIPDGFDAEWAMDSDNISFTLTGLAQNLEKIQLSSLNFRVDFADYAVMNDIDEFTEGIYECYLSMELPAGIEMVEPVAMEVVLTKRIGEE